MQVENLGDFCLRATAAGPTALASGFPPDDARGWRIGQDAAAAADLRMQPAGLPSPLIDIPLKLGTLAAAQLAAIGTLLTAPMSSRVGVVSLGRTVVDACSAIAWTLDDRATGQVRHHRVWLLWAVAEGKAAKAATLDVGVTGAMSGSPERLAHLEEEIQNRFGVHLQRSGNPKDWRLAGQVVPGQRQLVVSAVERWFGVPGRRRWHALQPGLPTSAR